MPTRKEKKSTERSRKTGGELTAGIRFALEMDNDMFGEFAHLKLTEAEVAVKLTELWKIHGKEVTRDFIKANPGERPLCFWRIEAPKLGFTQPEPEWTGPGNEPTDTVNWKKACTALLLKNKLLSAAEIAAYEEKEKENANS